MRWSIMKNVAKIQPAELAKIQPEEIVKYQKKKIPQALREQVWLNSAGTVFETKCKTSWCKNRITAFDFQCGHNIPESKGGVTTLDNLFPICARCNSSMGNRYTLDEWSAVYNTKTSFHRFLMCFIKNKKSS